MIEENGMKMDFNVGKGACKHCTGHMRFYRGTFSCMMCGREVDHVCEDCLANKEELLVETA